jgi:hypothetical protein
LHGNPIFELFGALGRQRHMRRRIVVRLQASIESYNSNKNREPRALALNEKKTKQRLIEIEIEIEIEKKKKIHT